MLWNRSEHGLDPCIMPIPLQISFGVITSSPLSIESPVPLPKPIMASRSLYSHPGWLLGSEKLAEVILVTQLYD